MSKIYPILILVAIIGVATVGVYFLLNQKSAPQTSFNINQSPTPTNVIISPTPTKNDTKNNINMDNYQTLPDGLKIQDEVVGTGAEVKSGDTVTVNYLGTLENGTKFDSSFDRNQPFTTQIGVGQVIKGWDEGIIGMKVGGKRKLVIPPTLGYGSQDLGAIPPNSTLIFEVELLGLK